MELNYTYDYASLINAEEDVSEGMNHANLLNERSQSIIVRCLDELRQYRQCITTRYRKTIPIVWALIVCILVCGVLSYGINCSIR